MGIRIEEKIFKKLEKIAEESGITPNQQAKIAITEWLDIINNARNHNMIIIKKNLFKSMLEIITEEEIKPAAAELEKDFLQFVRLQLDLLTKKVPLKEFLPILMKTLGKHGLMWVEHCDYKIRADRFVEIKGNHSFNELFSALLAAAIGSPMEELFKYEIVGEKSNLLENIVELLFKPLKYVPTEPDTT